MRRVKIAVGLVCCAASGLLYLWSPATPEWLSALAFVFGFALLVWAGLLDFDQDARPVDGGGWDGPPSDSGGS